MISALYELFYPIQCALCQRGLARSEQFICIGCLVALPYTMDHLLPASNSRSLTRSRLPSNSYNQAHALFRYKKKGVIAQMLHLIKSKKATDLMQWWGYCYGYQLKQAGYLAPPHPPGIVLPIPLHPSRKRFRGYNQSFFWGVGLAQALNIPVGRNWINRTRSQLPQVAKSRAERIAGSVGLFDLSDRTRLKNTSVILVDDVLTTGATWCACSTRLWQAGCKRIDGIFFAVSV